MTETRETLVYKITTKSAWRDACGQGGFAGSADDERDGFIHLSAVHRVAATAAKYFTGVADLVLVAFRASDLGSPLRWEPSRGGDLFPHYYGVLPVTLALGVQPLPLDRNNVPLIPANLASKAFP